jgi:hypothetical protein
MFSSLRQFQFNRSFYLWFILLILNFAFFFIPDVSAATQASFRWESNTEPDLAGYRIFHREQGQDYDYANPIWEGTDTYCTIYDLDESKTYFFVARAFDNEGYESENSLEASLEPGIIRNEPPTAVVVPDYLETAGETVVTLDGSASTDPDDGIDAYLWTQVAGDPVSLSNPTSAVTTFTTPKTESFDKYIELQLTVTDRGGLNNTTNSSVYVRQNEMPRLSSVAITGPDRVNEGSGAQFTLTANYSDGSTNHVTSLADWRDNSSYAGITSYGYLTTSLVASDQLCMISASYEGRSDTHHVMIDDTSSNSSPAVDFNYTPWGKMIIFKDRSTANDGTIVSWHWDFGDGKYSTRQNPWHRYVRTGNYPVTLTVTDNEGASNAMSKTVSITR